MSRSFDKAVRLVNRLHSDKGCPWDRAQKPGTLKKYLLEEAYEVAEAIDEKDPQKLKEELGDLLFHVLSLAKLAQKKRFFDINDVLEFSHKKMVCRHPHVFAGTKVKNTQNILDVWNDIKSHELSHRTRTSALDGIPRALPAVLKAEHLQKKAVRAGFKWKKEGAIVQKISSEARELSMAVKSKHLGEIKEEIGDILFSVIYLSRHMNIDAQEALNKTNKKFKTRFLYIEKKLAEKKTPMNKAPTSLLIRLWNESKKRKTKTKK